MGAISGSFDGWMLFGLVVESSLYSARSCAQSQSERTWLVALAVAPTYNANSRPAQSKDQSDVKTSSISFPQNIPQTPTISKI